ncbi:hypothetical protein CBS101457_005052 [Exobasidium rhododendri]|nr:hypothetical protein CBS101457_005052 [Exobasidium rhododendri]
MSVDTAKAPSLAAWQMTETDTALTIGPAAIPTLHPDGIIIEARAIAINPVDWVLQTLGKKLFDFLVYPIILGFDVAGTVHSVGENVTRYKVGDRVFGLSVDASRPQGTYTEAGESAFRTHVLVSDFYSCPIPDSMTYQDAATLPMGLHVAAAGLFHEDYLGLRPPPATRTVNGDASKQWVLITAGASSVGSFAIQLAVNAGYSVVTTCSPANFDLAKRLGATYALDYHRPQQEVQEEIIDYLSGREFAGALSVGSLGDTGGSVEKLCGDVVAALPKSASSKRKFVACISRPNTVIPEGVESAFVIGGSLKSSKVGKAIFEDYLPQAIASGQIQVLLPALVVGHGLESLQRAMDRLREGVSAQKVVVTL